MTTAIEYDANSKSHQVAVRIALHQQYMSGGFRRTAQIGVIVQFAALIRCLGEYFRLKYFVGGGFSLSHVEPFVLGARVCALLALVGILFYFGENYRITKRLNDCGYQCAERGNLVDSALYPA